MLSLAFFRVEFLRNEQNLLFKIFYLARPSVRSSFSEVMSENVGLSPKLFFLRCWSMRIGNVLKRKPLVHTASQTFFLTLVIMQTRASSFVTTA